MTDIYSVRQDYVMFISFLMCPYDFKFIFSSNVYWPVCIQKLFKALETGVNKAEKNQKNLCSCEVYTVVQSKKKRS